MSAKASLGFITFGAILALAVRAQPGFIDLHVTGLILIAVGLIRPAVAGWSSMAPKVRSREVLSEQIVAEDVEEPAAHPEEPASSRGPAHRTAPARQTLPARHPARSATRT